MKIKGKYDEAEIFARTIEDEAISQVQTMLDSPIADGAHARFMPDMHAGKGCTIGTTMRVIDKVCPNFVGVDIGCGVTAFFIPKEVVDLEKLKDVCNNVVVSGRNVRSEDKIAIEALKEFNMGSLFCSPYLKNINWLNRSMGTLGGGNHFISVDVDSNGYSWLVIHSGSRNLGKQVAEYYQSVAEENCDHSNEDRLALIDICKRNGMEKYLSELLPRIKSYKKTGMEYLEGFKLEEYLHDMMICNEWARINRATIAADIFKAMGWEENSIIIETMHNYIDSKQILRKGAVSAYRGERLLIPLNMRDGILLCTGKGNDDWNCSAPHGAGRIMSRAAARKNLNVEDFQASMEGIVSDTVCLETIDEAPMAYKDWKEIAELIFPTVTIVDHWKEVFNYKATES